MIKKMRKILGIDPSLSSTGFALLEYEEDKLEDLKPLGDKNLLNLNSKYTPNLIDYGTIETNSKDNLCYRNNYQRKIMAKLIEKYEPDLIVCEDQYGHLNTSTLKKLSHIRGNFMSLADCYQIPFYLYYPTTIKKIVTGKGNSGKQKMIEKINEYYDISLNKKQDNEADGISLALSFIVDNSKAKKI